MIQSGASTSLVDGNTCVTTIQHRQALLQALLKYNLIAARHDIEESRLNLLITLWNIHCGKARTSWTETNTASHQTRRCDRPSPDLLSCLAGCRPTMASKNGRFACLSSEVLTSEISGLLIENSNRSLALQGR